MIIETILTQVIFSIEFLCYNTVVAVILKYYVKIFTLIFIVKQGKFYKNNRF